MPMTAGARRQAAWRARHAAHINQLEHQVHDLATRLAQTEAERDRLAQTQCRHPAAAVDGGTCRACGTDVW